MKRSGAAGRGSTSALGQPKKTKIANKGKHETSLGLPMELAARVISFLDTEELKSLTLTNKACEAVVECLCKKRLEETLDRHQPLGANFQHRLKDPAGIDTNRTKPVHLPWRFLLWKALPRTYLRCQTHAHSKPCIKKLVSISPSGKQAVLYADEGIYVSDCPSLDIRYPEKDSLAGR